jgi:hypothetical protein
MLLHEVVHDVVDSYLEAVDVQAPGLVEGLYLTGSMAFGDFRPRTSDIDYVAVTAQRLDPAAVCRAAAGPPSGPWPLAAAVLRRDLRDLG